MNGELFFLDGAERQVKADKPDCHIDHKLRDGLGLFHAGIVSRLLDEDLTEALRYGLPLVWQQVGQGANVLQEIGF